jgi:23S rRNA (cytidine1920-2'-O)/16S rRNA (cytidine1409-2'-O)-methyltransferase
VSKRRRLDAELVRRKVLASRERAREAIEAGEVTVNGAVATKPSRQVLPGDAIELSGPPPRFVSRGGEKLDAALDAFGLDVSGLRAIDVGSSTGGFTDCLLQRGAVEVVAVDVGRAQLHEKIRADPRVHVMEQTNVRGLRLEAADIVVVDVSFIGLGRIMADLAGFAGSDLVVLVKPQFEAGKQVVSRGRGVVRDPQVWREVLAVVQGQARAEGLGVMGGIVSPIRGAAGNVEFLVHLRNGESGTDLDIESLVGAAEHLR